MVMNDLFTGVKRKMFGGIAMMFLVFALLLISLSFLIGQVGSKIDGCKKGDTVQVYESKDKFQGQIDDLDLLSVTFRRLDKDEYVKAFRYENLKVEKIK